MLFFGMKREDIRADALCLFNVCMQQTPNADFKRRPGTALPNYNLSCNQLPVAQFIECYLFTHRCTFSTVTASATTQQRRKLLLYSKEGCHLCDGLKVPLGTYVMAASCKASKCDEPCLAGCKLVFCRRRYKHCWTEHNSCHLL